MQRKRTQIPRLTSQTRCCRGHSVLKHSLQHNLQAKDMTMVVGETFGMLPAVSLTALVALYQLFSLLHSDLLMIYVDSRGRIILLVLNPLLCIFHSAFTRAVIGSYK